MTDKENNPEQTTPSQQEHPWEQVSGDSEEGYSRPLSRGEGRPLLPGQHPPGEQGPPPVYRALPQETGFSTRALTEGALMTALSVLLALVASYVPVLDFVGALLFPLPMIILVFRRGMKVGFCATLVLLLLSSLLLGPANGAVLLIQYGFLGLYLGYRFRKQGKPLTTLAWATLIAALGSLAAVLLSMYAAGLSIQGFASYVQEFVNDYVQALVAAGWESRILATGMSVEEYSLSLVEQVSRMLPSGLVLSSMVMTLILYAVSTNALRRRGYQMSPLPRFNTWRLDWRLSWGLILGLLANWLGGLLDWAWLSTLGQNLNWIFCPLLALCGLALLLWCLKNVPVSLFLKLLLICLLVSFYRIAFFVLIFLAVVDSVNDVRQFLNRWIQRHTEES